MRSVSVDANISAVGFPWLAYFKIQLVYPGGGTKTFRHIAVWEFTFGMSLPPMVENFLTRSKSKLFRKSKKNSS